MLFKNKYGLLAFVLGIMLMPMLLIVSMQGVQAFLKASAAERLNGDKQHTFILPKASVHWQEVGRELRINDRFFDATNVKYSENTIIITGRFDDAETAVWQVLQKAAQGAAGVSLNRLLLLAQCLLVLHFIQYIFSITPLFILWNKRTLTHYLSPQRSAPFMPPRI